MCGDDGPDANMLFSTFTYWREPIPSLDLDKEEAEAKK